MSRKPQIRIEKCDDGYRFFVFPSKFHCDQPIGQSVKAYQTPNECMQELENFKTLVLKNGLCAEDEKYVKIERREIKIAVLSKEHDFFNNRYYFLYFDEDGQCVFERNVGYTTKENCKKGIKYVFDAINQDADS